MDDQNQQNNPMPSQPQPQPQPGDMGQQMPPVGENQGGEPNPQPVVPPAENPAQPAPSVG